MINENNLYIRISEFGNRYPLGFTFEEITKDLQVNEDSWEAKIISDYMHNALRSGRLDRVMPRNVDVVNPSFDTMFFVILKAGNEDNVNGHKYILKYDSFFNYIDYLELKEAYASSKSAKKGAKNALLISASLAIASIVVSIVSIVIQVKGDVNINTKQLKNLVTHIDSTKIIPSDTSASNKQFKILLQHIDSIRKPNR